MILEDLSDSRREKVEEIELDQARRVLRKAAQKMEIRHWNEVLRVLVELERLEEPPPPPWGGGTDVLQVVEPNQRNPTSEHVLNPRSPRRRPVTLCGYRADDWLWVEEVPQDRFEDLLERPKMCDRCCRSIETRLRELTL